jgi:hypothetical protein
LPKAANGNPIATIPLPSLNDSRLDSMKMPKLNPDGTRATDAQGDPIMVFLDGTADGSNGTVLPVGADGQVRGGLRVQTQDPTIPNSQTVSSQYSRVAKIGGTCTPTLTINRAKADATTGEKEQNRTTSARDIHFTLVSNMPIDSTTLELSDFLVGGSTALNARVTAITALPSGSTTVFDVVARADDSGDITLSLPADAVTGPGGLTNTAASTSTDGVVTYRNPLIVAPSPLRLIAGEASGEDYTISIDPMAPKEPIAPLTFTIGLDAIGQTYNLAVSPTSPSISVDETSTTVRVTVPALPDGSTIPPATVATITHTVDTTDQEYAGLRVPSLAADLYSTNPQIKIDKEVYTCPDTTTSADNNYDYITKSGNCTVIPSNSSLKDAEKVWFVFTVENTSPDTWPTSLSGIQVTDDTLTDGTTCGPKFSHPCVIGTLPSLARGETHGFVWERNPVAIHTTQEGGV